MQSENYSNTIENLATAEWAIDIHHDIQFGSFYWGAIVIVLDYTKGQLQYRITQIILTQKCWIGIWIYLIEFSGFDFFNIIFVDVSLFMFKLVYDGKENTSKVVSTLVQATLSC